MADMSTYLSAVTADYTTTEMTLTPQNTMIEEGQKTQYYHEFDDGSIDVITASESYFHLTMMWDYMVNADAATLLDFWHAALKANGLKRSFYLTHPVDLKSYTAKFLTPITFVEIAQMTQAKQIPNIKFNILGNKP